MLRASFLTTRQSGAEAGKSGSRLSTDTTVALVVVPICPGSRAVFLSLAAPGNPAPDRLLGDKGYSLAANRARLTRRRIAVTIPDAPTNSLTAAANAATVDAPRLRPGHLQTPQRRRMLLQPLQTVAGGRHPLRQEAVNYRAGIVLASVILWLKT